MLMKLIKVALSILFWGLLILGAGLVALMHWNVCVLKSRDARLSTGRMDIHYLGSTVEMYRLRSGTLPPSLQALVPDLLPTLRKDPWGNPYVYRAEADHFSIASHRADKQAGTEDDLVMGVRLDGGRHIRKWTP